MKCKLQLLLVAMVLVLVGCNSGDTLSISGTISGASGDTLRLKCLQNNQMTEVSSKVLKSNGRFKFSVVEEEFPEYYYLQVNNGGQLLVVKDSLDAIVVNGTGNALKSATIEGSELSVRIQEMVNSIDDLRADYKAYVKIADAGGDADGELGTAFVEKLKSVKSTIKVEILNEPKSYYAYYALFQRLSADNMLFSPYNDDDYKYFAAVATTYDVFHEDDPRTKALYEMVSGVLSQKRNVALRKMIDEAPAVVPNVVMNDINGKEQDLSKLKGKVVILNFWASRSTESRLNNKAMLALYKKYKSRGLDVFQVSGDRSKILWEAAVEEDKLPWVNVCDFKERASQPFITYNVKELPTTYLIGRDGQMINKYTSIASLEKAIKAAL